MCTVHHYHMCTDVYLQGSWLGNEKVTGSCLPADVIKQFCVLLAALLSRSSKHDGGRQAVSFCNCIILPRLFIFLAEEAFSG